MNHQVVESIEQYYAMKRARKAALALILRDEAPSPSELDGMMLPHPFRDGELVRIDTLIQQVEATSQIPESGPGLPPETRYLGLLDLVCSHMSDDDAILFRYAAGMEGPESAGSILRRAYGMPVHFILTEGLVA